MRVRANSRSRVRRHRPLAGRRVEKRRRHPVLAAIADADQAVLRLLRTHGHQEPVETMMKALGTCGEYGAVWAAAGAIGASIDHKRRRQWLAGGATGPLAIGVNFLVKLAVGRERPLLEEHPALARAPSKLSFPSAHATSSVGARPSPGTSVPIANPSTAPPRTSDG